MEGSRKVLYAGLAGNVLVAVTKLAAAAVTHSSAMLSETVHSLVDTSNELLLLYGAHRAALPPDRMHPLGHGREVYFWSFMVALLIFALGAGVSTWEGVRHVLEPHPMQNAVVSYVVLGLAMVFEGSSWWIAFQEFRRRKGAGRGYLQAAQETKDPTTVMVFLEDSAALVGLALALAGTIAAEAFDEPRFDGAASIAIGVLLAVVAGFLARETKQLLIGEGPRRGLADSVGRIAAREEGVAHFNGLLAIQLAPREVVVALSLDFDDALRANDLQRVVANLEARIRRQHPEIVLLLVKPQSPQDYHRAHEAWMKR